MIGRLRGILLEIEEDEALIEVMGVGYIVKCGVRTLANLPGNGQETILHIESQTREDGTRLYGFLSKDERKTFQQLLTVQGVGPKAALSVLDILTPHELALAVAHEDKTKVNKANGVGPKLAQRIVIELKGKALAVGEAFVPMAPGVVLASVRPAVSLNGESVAALMGLGIPEAQSRQAVEAAVKALGPEAELAAVIRASLKLIGK
ncbi:Holliday junction branch migration protein RuvA [Asticcacaulis sp. DW145]|uniref:Holliday junction branch migration complex subunit RuvA n=1 Tax=Asticcacaulis currens TaxID=2984210 RepID=A0ABT5IEI8_9CAUL|nr:Holliday junction branch migration protein RuvA [Asticcacaulis currens]MDC7694607.1 Holliday junction branch migration protein RuvA [Asticcacaulis currens]BEV11032.1 Holliday junction branch migration protein RuvA [Asticcacaulis sp. DW145]